MSASAQIFGRDSAIHKATNILGLGIPSWLDKKFGPKEADDPTLNLDPGQTSTYGAFITRTHGTIGQSGNIIWLEGNKLRAVVKKAKKSGKGGGAPAGTATVSYFATFAVGLCEGPIAGVRRIWIGPDLIYDAGSDDLETIISSNKRLSGFKVYLGTDTQAPDTRIQADRGAANTPSYAGLAYIVIKDLALKNYGDSIAGAQVKVEVVNQGSTAISSRAFQAALEADETFSGYMPPSTIDGPTFGSIIARTGVYACSRAGAFSKSQTYPAAYDLPRRVIGAEYAYATSAILINVDGTVYSASTGQRFEVQKIAPSNDVILWVSTASGTVGEIRNIAKGAAKTGLNIRGFCIDSQYVYAISGATLYKLDIATLATVSTVTLPGASYAHDACYLSLDGGLIWLSPSSNGILRGYDIATGALVKSFTGIIYNETGTIGEPSSVIGGLLAKWSPILNRIEVVSFSQLVEQRVQLSAIVTTEAARSALIKPSDIDTTDLAGSVIGYRVTSSGSIRNALEPLRAAYPFDVFQSGYKIKFRSRGTASVATIPIGDLAADTQLEESREMDSQLPSRVSVQYLDRNRDYDQNEQEDARLGATDGDTQEVSIQVVMTGAQAKQVAEKLLALAWLERTAFSFKLPPIYGRIEAADTIKIVADYAVYELMLGSVSHDSDGMLSCTGVPSNASLYTSSTPADEGQQPPVTIPLQGSTFGALIDCPVIDETLQNSPGFIVGLDGYSAGWSGGNLLRSSDSGQTWADVQAFSGRATMGFASTVLGVHSGSLIQRGGSLTVSASGLEGVTEAQMLGGSNIAAYGAPGRWEVIRFQNATLNGDGAYTLDTFWRGDKGTEWATGLHVAGDSFVLLTDPDLAFVGMATESIGLPRDYRMVTFDADIDSAASQSFTYAGANLECLSPVYAKGTRSSGDLAATWTRRSRLSSSWWTNGVVAPIGETTEAYEVDVMQGAAVKRTISSLTPAITYTSAQQVTDFGSAQASITLKIYQLSTAVGRGLPLEVTL